MAAVRRFLGGIPIQEVWRFFGDSLAMMKLKQFVHKYDHRKFLGLGDTKHYDRADRHNHIYAPVASQLPSVMLVQT